MWTVLLMTFSFLLSIVKHLLPRCLNYKTICRRLTAWTSQRGFDAPNFNQSDASPSVKRREKTHISPQRLSRPAFWLASECATPMRFAATTGRCGSNTLQSVQSHWEKGGLSLGYGGVGYIGAAWNHLVWNNPMAIGGREPCEIRLEEVFMERWDYYYVVACLNDVYISGFPIHLVCVHGVIRGGSFLWCAAFSNKEISFSRRRASEYERERVSRVPARYCRINTSAHDRVRQKTDKCRRTSSHH